MSTSSRLYTTSSRNNSAASRVLNVSLVTVPSLSVLRTTKNSDFNVYEYFIIWIGYWSSVLRAVNRLRVEATLPIYVPLATSSIIRDLSPNRLPSRCHISASPSDICRGFSSGRDDSGRHPKSESVAFGLSMNGNCTSNMHTFLIPTSFFFQISHIFFRGLVNP